MAFELRARPTQKRSAQTFDMILETSIHILEEEGWDGFNTNLVAERAGIGIQTLYRYFPNKLSIVATLAQNAIEDWNTLFVDVDQFFHGEAVFNVDQALLAFVTHLKQQPGGVAIRLAMGASPELRAMDRQDNHNLAALLSEAIARRLGVPDSRDLFLSVLVCVETSVSIVDHVIDLPPDEADDIIRLGIEMQQAFLSDKLRDILDRSQAGET